MKELNTYITEKLKINKDSKVEYNNGFINLITNIVRLCDAPSDADEKYVKNHKNDVLIQTLADWISKDIDDIKGIGPYVDKDIIRKTHTENYFSQLDDFHHDPDRLKDAIKELIDNGRGTEVSTTGLRKDPKIYYDNKRLIYHQYIYQLGNIDRLFEKIIF